jgi:peptidyl-dipeptidase Dcp
VLANYAKHYQTGEPMPKALLDKVIAASKFNQGFTTTEYLGAAFLDQRWHQVGPEEVPAASGVLDFEAAALKKDGVDFAPVPPRYRTPYFSHIMGGYSAGYYAYIWSEVLDADSVEWLKAHGGLTRGNGDHFRATLLSRGGSKDALQLFRDFAGRDPDITPLLKRRGLDAPLSDDSSKVPDSDPKKTPVPSGGR